MADRPKVNLSLMDTHQDNPSEPSDANGPPSEAAGAEAPPEAPAGEQGSGAPGMPRGPRRRRRRRRGPRPAPTDAPRLGSAVEEGEAAPSEGAAADAEGGTGEGARPVLKLRNFPRRRRRLSHPPGLRSGTGEPAFANGAAQAAEGAPQEGAPAAEGEGVAPSERPPGAPRRRRRRRRGPRPEAAAGSPEAATGEAAGAAPGHPSPGGRGRPGRDRGPRRDGEGGPAQGGGRERDGRDRAPRNGPGGERRDRGDQRGDGRGRRGAPGGRDRGRPERSVERKLYSLDAVVDRGFEDVEPEGEGETRRVHWTIVKRTVADQISRKPVSASYVLQREGGDDTEFPSLGAARNAVNKTIVHPEKLTPSKSEIAALKGSSR